MTHRYSFPIRLLLLLVVLHDQQTSGQQKAYPYQAFNWLTNQNTLSNIDKTTDMKISLKLFEKIILHHDWLNSWRALTLKWHLDCFRIWHFYKNSNFSKISIFRIFQFWFFYSFSGKEKKKRRDMAQGFNDLLIQPMDDLYRWSFPLTQSLQFNFTITATLNLCLESSKKRSLNQVTSGRRPSSSSDVQKRP